MAGQLGRNGLPPLKETRVKQQVFAKSSNGVKLPSEPVKENRGKQQVFPTSSDPVKLPTAPINESRGKQQAFATSSNAVKLPSVNQQPADRREIMIRKHARRSTDMRQLPNISLQEAAVKNRITNENRVDPNEKVKRYQYKERKNRKDSEDGSIRSSLGTTYHPAPINNNLPDDGHMGTVNTRKVSNSSEKTDGRLQKLMARYEKDTKTNNPTKMPDITTRGGMQQNKTDNPQVRFNSYGVKQRRSSKITLPAVWK